MLSVSLASFALESKVFDGVTLTSKIFNMERKFALYLPTGYETSQRSYPVFYLLHDSGDEKTGWVQFGEARHIAGIAIQESESHSHDHCPAGCQYREKGVFQ